MRLAIGRVYARLGCLYRRLRPPYGLPHESAALCGLPVDGSGALFVQGTIACSVGDGSERWFPTPEASTRAPPSLFMSRSPLPSSFGPSPWGAASPRGH